MNECFITFLGGVSQKSVTSLVGAVSECAAKGIEKITVNLSSTGGSLDPAFAAYHFLRSVNVPLVMHNIGNVESSAVLLYLAAATRTAVPRARFLLHPFHWTFGAGSTPLPNIRDALASLEFDSRRYAEIFNERTKGADKPVDVFQCLQGEQLVIGAAEAVFCGIATCGPEAAVQTVPAEAVHIVIAGD